MLPSDSGVDQGRSVYVENSAYSHLRLKKSGSANRTGPGPGITTRTPQRVPIALSRDYGVPENAQISKRGPPGDPLGLSHKRRRRGGEWVICAVSVLF